MVKNESFMKNNKSPQSKLKIEGKTWVIWFVFATIFGFFLLFLYNYRNDPYNYFLDEYKGNWVYSQYYKSRYILNNSDTYDCYIVGGSNAGVLNPELIEQYTGYNTYSYVFAQGNGYNYYEYVKFLIDKTDVKSIILHLSSTEVCYSRDYIESLEQLKVPEFVKGNNWEVVQEDFSFLTKSMGDEGVADTHRIMENGMVDWSDYLAGYNVESHVLINYNEYLTKLKNVKLSKKLVLDNLNCIKEIKALCETNGVELVVINGPTFISKRSKFECNAYYDYLEQLVQIVDVWDFSGFTSINANPYNFYDVVHYSYDVGDEMIKFMYGESELDQEFGILLTKDNIVDYIQDRKRDFEEKKLEFEETGTIEYKGYDDPSRITGIEFE